MTAFRRLAVALPLICALLTLAPQAQDQAVPANLTSLLAAPQSEMRMVTQRYSLDRNTLSGNYANGSMGRGGGRGARGGNAAPAAPVVALVPLSPARIARLKRFDMNWQAALGKIDAAKLTPGAKTD